jgi:predicted heme/steroid binding protein
MTKIQKISLIASAVLSILIIGGALLISQHSSGSTVAHTTAAQRPVSKAELARSDGKDGHDCLVAVDGMVYKIQDFTLWQDGKHESSKGLAYCGADLSKMIDKAPHGRSKLDVLIKVGRLES